MKFLLLSERGNCIVKLGIFNYVWSYLHSSCDVAFETLILFFGQLKNNTKEKKTACYK